MSRKGELAATVHVGSDGWLFHREDFVAEQVTGSRPLTDARVTQWQEALERRHDELQTRGSAYVLMVVPEKYVVYSDKVHDGFCVSEERPFRQIERALSVRRSPVPVVYPAEALIAERTHRDTYFKTDTHWNVLGAHLGYRDLCGRLALRGLRVLGEEDLDFQMLPFDGDLAIRLDPEPESVGLFGTIQSPKTRLAGANQLFARGNVAVFEQEDRSLPRAVLFRDSFAHLLIPFFAESFSRLVAVSTMDAYFELVESEKPDVVITQVAERLLNNPLPPDYDSYVPDGPTMPPFEELCRVSVADVARWRI